MRVRFGFGSGSNRFLNRTLPALRSAIWYSDGSVVLQAETTQFRVHASILAAGSSVFKDMFEVAQAPNNVDSQVDGCPLVQLYDDKPQDVEFVLLALYDWKFFQSAKKEFAQVAAMWRFGKKYEFDEIRDDALRRLEYIFPSSLEIFQARFYPSAGIPVLSGAPIRYYPGLVFDAINLARATNMLSILPAALARACSTSESQQAVTSGILEGLPGVDGALVSMSDADKTLCVHVTFQLIRKQWSGLYGWLSEVAQPGRCSYYNMGYHNSGCSKSSEAVRTVLATPVAKVVALNPSISGGSNLCTNCKSIAETKFRAAQRALWGDLPALFRLPSWQEIKSEMARLHPSPTEE
ncbi:hypothetical protein B0H19DRAFT_1082732 [Mycena capillaripes]|nr:hypothetical protein B0H19DRAFT_1082732 [Mycena capillaripes]